MADDIENDETEESEESSGKKKKIIIFAVVGLLLVGLSVGGTLFAINMLNPSPPEEVALDLEATPEGEEPEEVEPPKNPAIYYPLKPPIIVNFQARGRQRFLKADVTLLIRDDDVVDAVEIHMPMIRNALVFTFGEQVYEEIQTEQGRELLRQQALKELQDIMEREIGKPGIERLLFTNLVMQ